MAGRTKSLTDFGKDLDSLLARAGKFTLREYADECGVSYKYLLQLRTDSTRKPGKLYVDLLKPFARLKILNLAHCHEMSMRHRGKPLSLSECKAIFPDFPDVKLLESIAEASKGKLSQEAGSAAEQPTAAEGKFQGPQAPEPASIYRRVFVGREMELRELQESFDRAVSGHGSLLMVAGEPGIGKTALCQRLADHVASKGGKTLVGHCYEAGSLSLPYLAFVEAMRSYVLDRDAENLRQELGPGAGDVARIVSEITEKLDVPPRAGQNSEEDRYRLLQAVTSFLNRAASAKPMLVVLEDLHDADKGTLEMLTYVSRDLSNARLLIVGTYRDVEVDRTHPLSAALAELRRVSAFGRVLLRGLNADEVQRMLEAIAGERVSWSLGESVHRQTEGNPLFIQEVVRFLIEQKLLVRTDGQMIASGAAPLETSIPEGLRDVIGKRLSNLSETCNRLLSTAAVIGREFRLDVLQRVSALSEEEVFASIEEAKKVAVIEERPAIGGTVSYRFAHAFFRTTLYEEIIAPRRIRLHQQVARALEAAYSNRLNEHAAEMAEHFSYSTEPADLSKAVSYGEMAARRAVEVYNPGEAARLLQQALKVQEVLDPTDKGRRCDLLLAVGVALTDTGGYRHAVEKEFSEALSLAEEIGDSDRAARACYRAAAALGLGGSETWAGQEMLLWAEKADRYAKPNTIERAWADNALGATKLLGGVVGGSAALLEKSFEQARSFGDSALLARSGTLLLASILPWSDEAGVTRVAEEAASTKGYTAMYTAFGAFLNFGRRKRAEQVAQAQKQHAALTGQAIHVGFSLLAEATLAFMDGRLQESVAVADHLVSYARQTGFSPNFNIFVHCGALRPFLYLGNITDRYESDLWKALRGGLDSPVNVSALCLLAAYLGHLEEASQRLDRMLASRPNITSRDDLTIQWMDIAYLESAVIADHHRAADALLQRFAGTTLKTTGYQWTSCIPRHLGGAAALLGRYEEARKYYEIAIGICSDMNFRPELALTRMELAELLLDHFPGDKRNALEHLDFSINEFREMKMQPSLERALRG